MSLVHSPEMTPEKIAANRSNARQSHGPATVEGLKRSRAANLQHGLRSRFFQEAMGVLGEDPEDFEQVHQALVKYWQPSDPFREMLVTRLARLTWRLDRGECEQEGFSLRHARAAEVREAAESKAKDPVLEAPLAHLHRMLGAVGRHDFDALFEEYSSWQNFGIAHFRLREVLQESLTKLAEALDNASEEPSSSGETPPGEEQPSEAVEGKWKRLKELIESEIARLEKDYAAWKKQHASRVAEHWLERVEAHTSAEALHRRENFLSLEVARTVRLLRQLREQDQEGDRLPAEKKIADPAPSHDVVENQEQS